MATWQIGRNGRVYAAVESVSYGTAVVLASADAIRHLGGKLSSNPRARVNSPERRRDPSLLERFTRRETAGFGLNGIFYPSGTLNTLCDHSALIEASFGSKTNVTLAAVVAASPAPTTTVFTLDSVTGLAVGDAVLVNATSGGNQVRWITAINTLAITVAPALSAAPTSGDSVKGGVTYKLGTAAAPSSFDIAHYLDNLKYEVLGAVCDRLKLNFDANAEVMWDVSGPAKNRRSATDVQSEPAAFTLVGTQPPSGLTGYLRVGGNAEEVLKAEIEIVNGFALQNDIYGTSQAAAAFRKSQRQVRIKIDTKVSDDITIVDAAEDTTDVVVLMQTGLTEGKIVALYAPAVELEAPPDDDLGPNEDMEYAFSGVCKGVSGNDELSFACF